MTRPLVRGMVCCVLATAAWAQVVVVYPPPVPPPTVVMVERAAPPRFAEAPEAYAPPQQTNYLIALKGDEVRLVDQYWVKGGTLYYVTAEHQQKAVPMERVDLALTVRLNRERDGEFQLPAARKEAVARTRTVSHTATTAAHKRCTCVATRASSTGTGGASRAKPPR